MTSPLILGVGGAHIDRRGRTSARFLPGASNPGIMREEVGGGVLNALRAARNHGCAAAIISVRGGDGAGESVARAIANADIEDLSGVFLDRTTPSYTAILDQDGEVVAALADMGLYDGAFERQLRRRGFLGRTAEADALLIDANLPEAAIGRAIESAGDKPVYAIAISPAKAVRLKPFLPRLGCLFMNLREAKALTGAPDALEAAREFRNAGLAAAAITAGGRPVIGFDGEGLFCIAPPAPTGVIDVTGAGDALAGTTVAHLARGASLRVALRFGVAAAVLTVASEGAAPAFSVDEFEAVLKLVPKPQAVS